MRRKSRKRNRLMTPGEVAVLFGVDPNEVDEDWAQSRHLRTTSTSAGDLRFYESGVSELLRQEQGNSE